MKTTSRRVQRTRTLLHDALMQLLSTSDYDQITVQEIAEAAGLSRATFYLHYQDKSDLLMAITAKAIDNATEKFRFVSLSQSLSNPEPSFFAFSLIESNHHLYRTLLCNHSTTALIPQLRVMVAQALELHQRLVMSEQEIDRLKVELSLICSFMACGFIGVAAWWLENDMEYSAENIADISRRLNLFGAMPFLHGGE